MKIRDFIALPFLIFSTIFELLAVRIGGKWTAEVVLESYKKIKNIL